MNYKSRHTIVLSDLDHQPTVFKGQKFLGLVYAGSLTMYLIWRLIIFTYKFSSSHETDQILNVRSNKFVWAFGQSKWFKGELRNAPN